MYEKLHRTKYFSSRSIFVYYTLHASLLARSASHSAERN